MIRYIYSCIVIYLLLFYSVSAQQQFTISGFVRDAKTGEELTFFIKNKSIWNLYKNNYLHLVSC